MTTCPHCGEELTDLWDLYLMDGESAEADCEHCEQPIIVSASISVEYTVRPDKEIDDE